VVGCRFRAAGNGYIAAVRGGANVWSAARLQAESLGWVVWSAQMYRPVCGSQAPGHNEVRASLVMIERSQHLGDEKVLGLAVAMNDSLLVRGR
jgi:hypothetical protein